MADKLNRVLEGFKPIPMKRMFYPRGMRLSEDFINAFHREYDRLIDEGLNPRSLVERFGKAMRFHASETRKYRQLDEDSANKRIAAAKKAAQKAENKRTRQQGKERAQEVEEEGHHKVAGKETDDGLILGKNKKKGKVKEEKKEIEEGMNPGGRTGAPARSEDAQRLNSRIKMLMKRGHSEKGAREAAEYYMKHGKTRMDARGSLSDRHR